MKNSVVPRFGQLVRYYEANRRGLTVAKLALVMLVHEPENPASPLDLKVRTLNGGSTVKDVPFGPNSVGHWGWEK